MIVLDVLYRHQGLSAPPPRNIRCCRAPAHVAVTGRIGGARQTSPVGSSPSGPAASARDTAARRGPAIAAGESPGPRLRPAGTFLGGRESWISGRHMTEHDQTDSAIPGVENGSGPFRDNGGAVDLLSFDTC